MTTAGPWSFSRIKAFETCPKQFYHVTVRKEYPFAETEATRYGTAFHKACEEFIRDDIPVPPEFAFAKSALAALKARPGNKHCERRMGLTADLEPCDFFAPDVWFRGVVDLLIIDGSTAWIIDYKTGKSARYADTGQLELMALSVFKHFPQVEVAHAGLLFVIANSFIRQRYERVAEPAMWRPWLARHADLNRAYEADVWNPKPSGLCRKHCPVVTCPHNGGR